MALKYTANFKPGDNLPSGAANEIITNVNKNITDIENLENKIKRKIELNNILTCDVLNSYVTSGIGHFSVGSLYVLTEGGNLITSSLGEPGNYPTKRVFDNAIVVVNGIGVNDDDTKVSFELLHKGVALTKSTLYMGEITVSDLNAFIENTEVLTKDFKYIYKLSDAGQLTSLYNYSSKEKTTEPFDIGEMVVLNYNSVGICTLNRFEKDNTNAHICLLAKNENGRKAINRILSEANLTGFYYRARIDYDLLMSLPEDDVWITTACIGGINRYTKDNVKSEKLLGLWNENKVTYNSPHTQQFNSRKYES